MRDTRIRAVFVNSITLHYTIPTSAIRPTTKGKGKYSVDYLLASYCDRPGRAGRHAVPAAQKPSPPNVERNRHDRRPIAEGLPASFCAAAGALGDLRAAWRGHIYF